MNGLTFYSASLARGEIPDGPFIVLDQMATADPSRSPAGTESAWCYTHLPGTAHLHQQPIFRPTVGVGGAARSIDLLFLADSSAHPVGGVHGGPGADAAHAALTRAGLRGWAARQASAALMRRLYR